MSEDQDPLRGQLIVGIDLGTTKSGVAVWRAERGRVELLPDASGALITPSLVGWDREGPGWIVGQRAKELAVRRPGQVAYSVKRYIGRWFDDPAVARDRLTLNYTLTSGGGADQLRDVVIDFGPAGAGADPGASLRLSAPEVSSRVLAKLRADAAAALGVALEDVKHAVVTVPAYFNVLQRRATHLAGGLAGLDVVAILNEPTAAALAYSAPDQDLLGPREKRLLVYDLGGGTFDVSLLEAKRDQVGYAFYTVVVDGDTRLGGDDIDDAVARWLADEIAARYGHAVRPDDQVTRARLRWEAEKAKIALSTEEVVAVTLPALDLGSRGPFDAVVELRRARLEECAAPVLRRTVEITRRAVLEVAGLGWDDIDEVLLVGGQTRMPAVRRAVEEVTGRRPRVSEWPERLVALGAGEYARILGLGQHRFPENALVNVLALPLGIRLDADTFKVLVGANVTVPHRSAPYLVTTTENNQTSVRLEVLQGARGVTRARDCVVVGSLDMEVPSAKAGEPRFEVVFDVKSDGTMSVLLSDLSRLRAPEVIDVVTERAWRDASRAAPAGEPAGDRHADHGTGP
jgi:molecular chaperone DnaK